MHIITNGFEEVQTKKMENSRIKKYFDKIITSESVGVKKPNPKIFDYALQSANAKAEHSIMIGDNYEADVQGALNMSMRAIFCNFEMQSVAENILSINHLTELKNHL
jgi:putative hydrolase of the HAD superfamily